MKNAEVSVIIPMKNVEKSISQIIKYVNEKTEGIETEIILVDMNSTDKSLVKALKTVKEEHLCGYVVQSGSKNLPSALNAGVFKASGKYISFIFPRQMYNPFVKSYYETAEKYSSDFVFGKFPQTNQAKAINFSTGSLNGAELFKAVLNNLISFDISAIMVRREFLISSFITFDEKCLFGYAEKFIYEILLNTESINQADVIMQRDGSYLSENGLPEEIGFDCFTRVEAMADILEQLRFRFKLDKKTAAKFQFQKMPEVMLSCINLLLKEGSPVKTVKAIVKTKGYEKYLNTSPLTDASVKRSVYLWKYMPRLYKY